MATNKRGPKPGLRMRPKEPLAVEPPASLRLTGRSRSIYRELSSRLRVEGFSSEMDARTVGLAAQTAALVERLQGEVDKLPSLLLDGRPHPLVTELRQTGSRLQSLYGALFMSPRSRSSARLAESFRNPGTGEADELERFLATGEAGKTRFFPDSSLGRHLKAAGRHTHEETNGDDEDREL